MSARETADGVLTVLLSLLFLPGRVIEEGIHCLAALPFSHRVAVELSPRDGTAETVVEFRDGTPTWANKVAYVAPELAAAIAGLAVIVWWLLGGAVWWPSTTTDWVLLSVLGAQYLAIALPSSEDMDQTAEEQ